MNKSIIWTGVLLVAVAWALVSREPQRDPRLKNAGRKAEQSGWIFAHLEGTPNEIGFQHGYLLAPEIASAQKAVAHGLIHDTGKSWAFYRKAAQDTFWPKVEAEYREELQGIADGLKARGVKLDLWDVVVMNAWMELNPYYADWYNEKNNLPSPPTQTAPEHCSAFVATGSYTKDGRPVMGHNAWTGYMEGTHWNLILDIAPAKGHHFIMDGYPGLIHSGDDFGENDAGIMITETTISQFSAFDPNGIPEFVRARKAMQYSASIDDYVRIMTEGNNGAYANNWLVADIKTNEIADLELGLKNVNVQRTKDGYFVGSNFPVNEKLAREETKFALSDPSLSPNARRVRWEQLMAENKGKIDVAAGQRFLADHYDAFEQKVQPDERTLCGHNDLSPRGMKPWQPEYGAAGAVQNKVADAAMAEKLTLTASMGHSCGIHFKASEYLKKHPQFAWQKEYLRDMRSNPWATFRAQ